MRKRKTLVNFRNTHIRMRGKCELFYEFGHWSRTHNASECDSNGPGVSEAIITSSFYPPNIGCENCTLWGNNSLIATKASLVKHTRAVLYCVLPWFSLLACMCLILAHNAFSITQSKIIKYVTSLEAINIISLWHYLIHTLDRHFAREFDHLEPQHGLIFIAICISISGISPIKSD